MNVVWTHAARTQLRGIHDYIAASSSGYAKRMVERLMQRSKQLRQYPLSGEMVPEYNSPEIRELIEGNYRIIYHTQPERVDIIAVVHAARLLPATPPA